MVGPTNCTDTDAEGCGNIAPTLTDCTVCNHLGAVKDDLRSPNGRYAANELAD
jgi:hypothetical protein